MVRYRTRDGTEAKARRRFAWVTRNILFLALASLFADISTEMLYPILPIFLTQTLHAGGSIVGPVASPALGQPRQRRDQCHAVDVDRCHQP